MMMMMNVAKTKALISFAFTSQLICVFVFAYAKSWFSHNEAHIFSNVPYNNQTLLMLSLLEKGPIMPPTDACT